MLYIVSTLSGLLPIIFFLLFKRRNQKKDLWVIFIYVIISFLTDFLSPILNMHHILSGATTGSIFTVAEYALFTLFIFFNTNFPLIRKYLVFGTFIFIGCFSYNIFIAGIGKKFDSIAASSEALLVISYCILFFFEQLRTTEGLLLYSSKRFWIVLAMLFYLASTLIFFIATAYLSEKEQGPYWAINVIANITKNIFLSVAFTINETKNIVNNQKSTIILERQP